jgi:hypothetical protein
MSDSYRVQQTDNNSGQTSQTRHSFETKDDAQVEADKCQKRVDDAGKGDRFQYHVVSE